MLSVVVVIIQLLPVWGVTIQHEKSVESWAQPVEIRPHGSKFNGVQIQSYTALAWQHVKLYHWTNFDEDRQEADTQLPQHVYAFLSIHQ